MGKIASLYIPELLNLREVSPPGWKLSKSLCLNRKIRDVPHPAPPAHATALSSAFDLVLAPAAASGLQTALQQEIKELGPEPGQLSVGTA